MVLFSFLIPLVPLLLILFQRNKSNLGGVLLFYFFYSILSDLFINKLSLKFLESEFYAYRLFTVIEFLCFSFIIYKNLNSNGLKKVLYFSSLFFFLSIIIDLLTNSIENFDSLPAGVESILILFYCILTLYEQISTGKPLYSFPVLFAFSLILFFSGTFFLFIMSQNNFENEEFSTLYDYIVAISKILMTLLMSVGILANRRTETHNNRTFQKI